MAAFAAAARAAPTRLSVHLGGPPGVGKSTLAREIHRLSARPGRFVDVNCGRLGGGTLESTLFGHERGAFTGADRAHVGHLEASCGGTLFLDEVSLLPAAAQQALLGVLVHQEVQPVGSLASRRVDLRVLSASNTDLAREVARGAFRRDLVERLVDVPLRIPGLDERPGDVFPLIFLFASRAHPDATLTPVALDRLAELAARGSVRVLEKAIRTAVAMYGPHLTEHALHLPDPLPGAPEPPKPRDLSAGDLERLHRLRDLLHETDANLSAAADRLKLPRSTLRDLMRRAGVTAATHATWRLPGDGGTSA